MVVVLGMYSVFIRDLIEMFLFCVLVCCSCIHSRPMDAHQLLENDLHENFYPSVLLTDDLNLAERALPRLGRASPRLGRASPRLGRRAAWGLFLSRLNHPDQYDFDAINDDQYEFEPLMQEKRALPRLGRALEVNQQ